MTQYKIDIRRDDAIQEFQVTLHGPGLDFDGRCYIFRNPERAEAFAETVNLAYRQGFRDGASAKAKNESRRVLVVTGTTPDNVNIKPEGWWGRLIRRCRA